MANYATQLDLENVYGSALVNRLADHDGDGVADQAAIDDALTSASSIIDAYIGIRYAVPVSPPTPVVRDLAVDIAWYRLAYSRLKQTAEMRQRYDDAIALLQRIADGKAVIALPGTGTGGESGDQSIRFVARTEWLQRA